MIPLVHIESDDREIIMLILMGPAVDNLCLDRSDMSTPCLPSEQSYARHLYNP